MNEGKPYLLFVNLLTTGNIPVINLGPVMGRATLFIGKKSELLVWKMNLNGHTMFVYKDCGLGILL